MNKKVLTITIIIFIIIMSVCIFLSFFKSEGNNSEGQEMGNILDSKSDEETFQDMESTYDGIENDDDEEGPFFENECVVIENKYVLSKYYSLEQLSTVPFALSDYFSKKHIGNNMIYHITINPDTLNKVGDRTRFEFYAEETGDTCYICDYIESEDGFDVYSLNDKSKGNKMNTSDLVEENNEVIATEPEITEE